MKREKYRRAVFAVIYAKSRKGIEYLILRRKKHWKGWEFTKGKIEMLETKRMAARREAKEESGLRIRRIKRFGYSGKYFYPKKLPDRPGVIGQTFFLFAVEAEKGRVKIDRKEHSGFMWMNYGKALRALKYPNQKKSLKIVNKWILKKK